MKVGQGDLLFCVQSGFTSGHRTQDYKCLRTAVMICATLFFPKFDLSILIPRKLGQVPGICSIHVRYTQDPNLVTAVQQVEEIMQI